MLGELQQFATPPPSRATSPSLVPLFRLAYSKLLKLTVKPKTGSARPGQVKNILFITAVDFDQSFLYSTATSVFCDDHM